MSLGLVSECSLDSYLDDFLDFPPLSSTAEYDVNEKTASSGATTAHSVENENENNEALYSTLRGDLIYNTPTRIDIDTAANPFAPSTPATPTYTPTTQSTRSAYSINPRWTMKTCTDDPTTSPSFKFTRPITPSVSSRSTTPCSSSSSSTTTTTIQPSTSTGTGTATVNIASQDVSKAVRYIAENLKREYDEKILEMEYRCRYEYVEKAAAQREVELERVREECRVHFERVLRGRMAEVLADYNRGLDESRIGFEKLLRERMAEVQATCNATVRQKDLQIARLKWKSTNAGDIPRSSRSSSSRLHREKAKDRERKTRLLDHDEENRTKRSRTAAIQEDEDELDHSIPQYVKTLPNTDGPNGLRSKFFNLQLELALERTRFLDLEEELKRCRDEIAKYQEGEREMVRTREYEEEERRRQRRDVCCDTGARRIRFSSLSAPPSPSPSPPPPTRAKAKLSSRGVCSTPSIPERTRSVSPHPPSNQQQQQQKRSPTPTPTPTQTQTQMVVTSTSTRGGGASSNDDRSTIAESDSESEFGSCRWDQLRYPESSEAEVDELDEDVYML